MKFPEFPRLEFHRPGFPPLRSPALDPPSSRNCAAWGCTGGGSQGQNFGTQEFLSFLISHGPWLEFLALAKPEASFLLLFQAPQLVLPELILPFQALLARLSSLFVFSKRLWLVFSNAPALVFIDFSCFYNHQVFRVPPPRVPLIFH